MQSDRMPDALPQPSTRVLVLVLVVMPVPVPVIVFVLVAGRVLLVPHLSRMT
jgi:hypothetical protein